MPELIVTTYNTHRERKRRDPVLDGLLREGLSMICLQEVNLVRAARIKDAFGPRSFVSISKHGLQYLVIVLPEDARFLSRRTIQLNGHLGMLPAAWSVHLGHSLYRAGLPGWTDALEPRIVQETGVSWRGVDFQLINTHLPFVPGIRNKTFARLQETLREENLILAGDLNATSEDLFLNDLVLAGRLSLAGTRYATHDSGRRIDYVMFRGDFRETGYSLEEGLSDHRVVQATLEV